MKNKKLSLFLILLLTAFSYEFYSAVPASVDAAAKQVIISGETVGIKINVDGALVLGLADIKTDSGEKICPAINCGIKAGDLIKSINGKKINNVVQLENIVAKSDSCLIEYERDGKSNFARVTPVKSCEDNRKKLGIWVRGGTTGIGTMTYVSPEDKSFGALGHPITDSDTGTVIVPNKGELLTAEITGIEKGESGVPGEIRGTVLNDVGDITKNCKMGIFGNVDKVTDGHLTPVAKKSEIALGDAFVLTDIAGGDPILYNAQILHISNKTDNNKGLLIKITDKRLIDLTGGIVQGMSGSPILQNGKLVGAITHVLVNDPKKGYGIFAETMIKEG